MSTEPSNRYPRLLADVGGTNVRFALERQRGRTDSIMVLPTSAHPSFLAAIRHYLAEQGEAASAVRHAAIGIANPVWGDRIQMTNHDWSFSVEAIRTALAWDTFIVINDFAALAHALPHLPPDALRCVAAGQRVDGAPRALIGPGTGLGVAGLAEGPAGSLAGPTVIAGEGGHVSFAPTCDEQYRLWQFMRQDFEHVSAERLLCGEGLSAIHAFVSGTSRASRLAPDAITAAALEDGDAQCLQAINLFCAILGSTAGNLALTLGARGGVYIGGGIVPRLGEAFHRSPFHHHFLAKGRFESYMRAIPVHVIHADLPALTGLSAVLDHALAGSPAR